MFFAFRRSLTVNTYKTTGCHNTKHENGRRNQFQSGTFLSQHGKVVTPTIKKPYD
jgi:hypothetical protein